METQQIEAHVSTISRMNAFYGIPNLSQETTAAVQQGAPAPEVYTPEQVQAPQPETDTEQPNAGSSPQNPVESFFAEATEQVNISNQAVALQQGRNNESGETRAQQQAEGVNEMQTGTEQPSAQNSAETPVLATGENPVSQSTDGNQPLPMAADSGAGTEQPRPANNPEPPAATALNSDPEATTGIGSTEPQPQAAPPQSGGYSQLDASFGAAGATSQLVGGNSNATQPGALFSALG